MKMRMKSIIIISKDLLEDMTVITITTNNKIKLIIILKIIKFHITSFKNLKNFTFRSKKLLKILFNNLKKKFNNLK
jgi:hypothetical protein